MIVSWPPAPDVDLLKELFAAADVEGLIADGCPMDEYDPEAQHFYSSTLRFPPSKFAASQTLPVLEQLWIKQFMLNDEQLAQRRSALTELAEKIAGFFGPEAEQDTTQHTRA